MMLIVLEHLMKPKDSVEVFWFTVLLEDQGVIDDELDKIAPIDVTPFSVTIVVAYLMRTRGMSLFDAMQHVRSIRPEARPNEGFMCQLEDFEKSLQGASKLP
ncbi:unnamed protein product [Sphenostylis stenocarpa]|uniref:protein-tyrosine-phosphatase n=1 Tax=Sphenostylis stenocarpa TaxID=92480 RepID=A0AA86S6L7_9FABA|nr:unnamed protein product [Sphenostylis stenocarpa]